MPPSDDMALLSDPVQKTAPTSADELRGLLREWHASMEPLEDRTDGSAGAGADNMGGDADAPGDDEDGAGDESLDGDDSDEEWIDWTLADGNDVMEVGETTTGTQNPLFSRARSVAGRCRFGSPGRGPSVTSRRRGVGRGVGPATRRLLVRRRFLRARAHAAISFARLRRSCAPPVASARDGQPVTGPGIFARIGTGMTAARGPTTTDPLMTVLPNTGVNAATWTYSRPDKMLTERGAGRGEASPPSADDENAAGDVVTPAPAPAAAAQRRSEERREAQARRRLEADLEAAADKIPSPMELFEKFFTPEMQDRAVRCTNARAAMLGKLLKFAENPDLLEHVDPAFREALERPAWIKANQSWPPKSIGEWKDINRDELKTWMGITYYRGLVKLPRVQDYWSRDTFLSGFGGQLGKVTGMSRRRYEMLTLQTREEEQAEREKHGRMGKISLWLREFETNCREARPAENFGDDISLDEQTVPCKSKWTSLTFKNKHKPAGQGYRIYSVNCVNTGYTIAFDLDAPDSDHQKSNGKVRRIVDELVAKLPTSREFNIYMDNLFTSVETFEQIWHRKHRACGTWVPRGKVSSIPTDLRAENCKDMQIGDNVGPMFANRAELQAWAWHDSGHVVILTNVNHGDEEVVVIGRRCGRGETDGGRGTGKVARAAPKPFEDYNVKMNGTDKTDQMRVTYTVQRRCDKPWKVLFYWMMDVIAVNMFALRRDALSRVQASQVSQALSGGRSNSRDAFQRCFVMELLGIHEGGHRRREYELANENARRSSFGSGSRAKQARDRRMSRDAEDGDADSLCGIADAVHAADPNFYLHFSPKKALRGRGAYRRCKECWETKGKKKVAQYRCEHPDCGANLHLECVGAWHLRKIFGK